MMFWTGSELACRVKLKRTLPILAWPPPGAIPIWFGPSRFMSPLRPKPPPKLIDEPGIWNRGRLNMAWPQGIPRPMLFWGVELPSWLGTSGRIWLAKAIRNARIREGVGPLADDSRRLVLPTRVHNCDR